MTEAGTRTGRPPISAQNTALQGVRSGEACREYYWRGVRTTSLIHWRVFSSTGPAVRLFLAARSALIFWRTILPSPANTAAAITGNSTDFGFSAIPQSY